MKQHASKLAGLMTNTSVKLGNKPSNSEWFSTMLSVSRKMGNSPMRTLVFTGYALTLFSAQIPRVIEKMA